MPKLFMYEMASSGAASSRIIRNGDDMDPQQLQACTSTKIFHYFDDAAEIYQHAVQCWQYLLCLNVECKSLGRYTCSVWWLFDDSADDLMMPAWDLSHWLDCESELPYHKNYRLRISGRYTLSHRVVTSHHLFFLAPPRGSQIPDRDQTRIGIWSGVNRQTDQPPHVFDFW